MAREITNSEDIIDSRDVIERIAALEDLVPPADEDDGTLNDEREELAALVALQDEAQPCASDWQHGAVLIRETYFTEYAQQLANDIGAIDANAQWPTCHIDWEAAADSLKQDYTEVDFDGEPYLVR